MLVPFGFSHVRRAFGCAKSVTIHFATSSSVASTSIFSEWTVRLMNVSCSE